MAAPIERLLQEWSAAEERITSLVMTRPEAYERYLRAARLVADALADVPSHDRLSDAYTDAPELTERVLGEAGYLPGEVSVPQVAGAAFAIRYRELTREQARARAAQGIGEARRSGDAWVTVEEQGRADAPMPGLYRRLEMRVADGAGIHAFVDEDPETGGPRYGVERVPLDPGTGDAVGQPTDRRMFGSPTEWERHVQALRAGESPP